MRANCGDLGISPDHIAVTGNSAGGHLSLMVAGVDGTLYPELEGDSAARMSILGILPTRTRATGPMMGSATRAPIARRVRTPVTA